MKRALVVLAALLVLAILVAGAFLVSDGSRESALPWLKDDFRGKR